MQVQKYKLRTLVCVQLVYSMTIGQFKREINFSQKNIKAKSASHPGAVR